jgi:glycosyltransferase involved in cell wall biosynthesis
MGHVPDAQPVPGGYQQLPAYPMVSCIMPTYNRHRFVPQAMRYFLEQDYSAKELIIVDDSPAPLGVDIPDCPEITYMYQTGRRSLGEKRNSAIAASRGDVIMHWDDDDWMARGRIRQQVACLLDSGAEMCGLDRVLFYDTQSGKLWLYVYPPVRKKWLAGGSLCYWKSVWERKKFLPITQGEDTQFVWAPPECQMRSLPDCTFYVALIHPGNTCAKPLSGPCWMPWTDRGFQELVGEDWTFYKNFAM